MLCDPVQSIHNTIRKSIHTMPLHVDRLRLALANGPARPRQLASVVGISQPILTRVLKAMGSEIVRIGAGPSIQYALHDGRHGFDQIPVYRVGTDAAVRLLGTLVPTHPEGFVMHQANGVDVISPGLPWWMLDMRPQGYMGRAYAAQFGASLGLPANLADWSDTHVLRALVRQGHDAAGNLLLGNLSLERFVNAESPAAVPAGNVANEYLRLARQATVDHMPGMPDAVEVPKFAAFVQTPSGPAHVHVKFSVPGDNPVTQRWRDLLLAEHLAMKALDAGGIQAARTRIADMDGQRFLEVERLDRVGSLGRRAVHSLAALAAEFEGDTSAPWPVVASDLAGKGHVTGEAARGTALLFAFGTLIGNTDMHQGNLAFVSERGRPYALASACDMLPMALAPRSGGGVPKALPAPRLDPCVDWNTWCHALVLAEHFLEGLSADGRVSESFAPAREALRMHLEAARSKMQRLA